MQQETRNEDPSPKIVAGVEAEPEDVVILNVEHAGDDLEQDPTDQHQHRQPFEHLGNRGAGGHTNSRGITDHNLASTTGMITSPSPTCSPWVNRYSQDGRVGQVKAGSRSQPTSPGMAWPSCGA